MATNNATDEKPTVREQQLEILRAVPGFHLNRGEPCLCGSESLTTCSKVGYSDFITYYHRCRECGNKFETYIEG